MDYKCEYGKIHTLGDACHCELSALKSERAELLARVAELERVQTRRETKWARLEFNAQLQNELTTANTIIEQARKALHQIMDDIRSEAYLFAGGNGISTISGDMANKALAVITEYQKGRQTP